MTLPLRPDAPRDFDFIHGDWLVRHRRLRERLKGCQDWVHFEGRSSTRPVLGGFGNLEDNVLGLPEGEVRAVALRSYDPGAGQWSIWWLDGRLPGHLDTPVVGRFTGSRGEFLADDVLEGRPIRVRFTWLAEPGQPPRWSQAFSPDGGLSWEENWTMEFLPLPSSR